MTDESDVPDNVCFVPLGGSKCKCTPNNVTWFIQRADLSWTTATLTYKFAGDVHDDILISDHKGVSGCLGKILDEFIEMSERNKGGNDPIEPIIELWMDGKQMGVTAAKTLRIMRKMHTAQYGYCDYDENNEEEEEQNRVPVTILDPENLEQENFERIAKAQAAINKLK